MQRTLQAFFVLLACAAAPVVARVAGQREVAAAAANPIRKVVTMLQNMMKKVEAEGEKEAELFEKYLCYCKTSGGALEKSISESTTKVPQLQSDIEEAEAKLAQLKEDVKNHQADRAAAKEAMATATANREKEAAAFAAEESEFKANIGAMAKAIAALEKGMAGGFLQTSAAAMLKRVVLARQDMQEADRQDLIAFLTGGSGDSEGYVPQSGEIVGILKQLKEEMDKDLATITAAEEAAIKAYDELMAAKKKEVEALTQAIEEKLARTGQLAVEIVQMKNDLTDSEQALIEDTKFLEDLKKNCATKSEEWEVVKKTRQEELVALADTIKILNDDDALELFKKTLPSASLLQVKVGQAAIRKRALIAVLAAQSAQGHIQPQLDLISLALRGKKLGFEKIIKMIDEMVETLKKEQVDDDSKKEYCSVQMDFADDKKKGLERTLSDTETGIATDKDAIATTKDEIEALEDGIKALDKAVAEATEQRKEENEDFTELLASDSAAKELLEFAKNRLHKFYNPKLYKPPPKAEDEDGVAMFAQVSKHRVQLKDAPPPPPESVGAYAKKSEESGGVIAMINLLVKDLDKEMTEAKAEEANAQKDYEKMMIDSAGKRASDSKAITEKESAKAELEGDLQVKKDTKASTGKELMATMEFISSLHTECDWLLKYYEVRKEARASEIDALGKAKAVLSGADYSFMQTAVTASKPQNFRKAR